jgi:hypothetical protein
MPDASKTKTVICPDCQKECTLTFDAEEGIYTGKCQNPDCGTDVGWCYEMVKRNKSLKKFEEMETASLPPTPKKRKRLFGT